MLWSVAEFDTAYILEQQLYAKLSLEVEYYHTKYYR